MVRVHCLVVLSLLCLKSPISESFKWSRNQQSSHVVTAILGSDVTLPCEFLLTAEDESAMQEFHVVYWTREIPTGSQMWQGLATKTSLIGNSDPRIIYHDKSRVRMENHSLTILNVQREDEAQYQCEVKSSFFTTPSVIKLNVLSHTNPSALSSVLPKGAFAGIGIAVILLLVVVIVIVGIIWKGRRKRRTSSETSSNLARSQSAGNNFGNNAAFAHVGPEAYYRSEMTISGTTNNESKCQLDPMSNNCTSSL